MRICFLLPAHWSGNLGGAELQVKYIIDTLREKGNHEIYYICREASVNDDNSVKIYKVKYRGYLSKFAHYVDYFQVLALLKQIAPDIIYTRVDSSYVGMAAVYCKKNPCKLIWHIAHQRDVEKYKVNNLRTLLVYPDRKIFEYGVKKAHIIIGQAQYQDSLLKKNFGRKCTAIIPNFHPLTNLIEKKEYPIQIVWVANVKASKQPEVFIRLAQHFKDRKNLEFIMIGAIRADKWQKLVDEETKDLPNFTYKGGLPIDVVNSILVHAHIFVNTSIAEGFPNTFIQAWLRKVAVVSLHIDPDNVVKNKSLGLVSGSFQQLITDVETLIQQPEQRKTMIERAYQYAVANYSLSNVKKLIRFFTKDTSYEYVD